MVTWVKSCAFQKLEKYISCSESPRWLGSCKPPKWGTDAQSTCWKFWKLALALRDSSLYSFLSCSFNTSLLASGKLSCYYFDCRVFIGRYDSDDTDVNWICYNQFQDLNDYDLYVSALYFTVTTIVTVGYGDISPVSSNEKWFCVCLMLIGVMSFSFTTGALSSVIATMDSKES